MSTAPTPGRGEVWLVDFDPSVGAEIQKVRPALVISVDSVGRLPLRLVVPLTDWKPHYIGFPWFVLIPVDAENGLSNDQNWTPQSLASRIRELLREEPAAAGLRKPPLLQYESTLSGSH